MAMSERQVQRITNNWSFPANDDSRVFSEVPIFVSSSTMSPNHANSAFAQHTSNAVVSTHARVCVRHNSSFSKNPRLLQITKDRLTRSLSSSTTFPWLVAAGSVWAFCKYVQVGMAV